MNNYPALVDSICVDKKNRLLSYDPSLKLIGIGRSAFVFRIETSDLAIKVFFPDFEYITEEEVAIYNVLQDSPYFPSIYENGPNYIVMDYIEGDTFFRCLTNGRRITSDHLEEVDTALSWASDSGLNPSDIHLRNIFMTPDGSIKLIDVARYKQTKTCRQWRDLKKAHAEIYSKPFFAKKMPKLFLNTLAFIYKKGWIPTYRV
ncbi:protein kinase family protein [Sporosarcina aquimarina]|uniref:Protein kinase family protein n=1 Tax=Sporosarcina aquimarina TaxID=114975 RepID=A0ABU4G0G7_9BACL|nr:protein kinase family protein [Sporosarcina aquimarina]MDW0110464.1 protein kinase family protein [Sporosarcina aquimarina]